MQATRESSPTVAGIRFTKVGKLYHFDHSDFPDLVTGDFVIVETVRGRQMGQVMGFAEGRRGWRHAPILRLATSRDMALRQHWEAQQDDAVRICRELAAGYRNLRDVKFVAARYNYDGSLLSFLYAAEEKVNPGQLWSALQRQFTATVEMRQIGPRDVARLLGGYGACGELRCCSTFLTDFSPISIKMAKAQGISLNPSEITGMCGRLRCCLVYEYEQYTEARRHLPRRGAMVGTPWGERKVIDVHPLQDTVTVLTPDGRKQVGREDIVPLAELRALQQKSKAPCNKHGDEPCECGLKPGERRSDRAGQGTNRD